MIGSWIWIESEMIRIKRSALVNIYGHYSTYRWCQFLCFCQRSNCRFLLFGHEAHDALFIVVHIISEFFRLVRNNAIIDGEISQQHFIRRHRLSAKVYNHKKNKNKNICKQLDCWWMNCNILPYREYHHWNRIFCAADQLHLPILLWYFRTAVNFWWKHLVKQMIWLKYWTTNDHSCATHTQTHLFSTDTLKNGNIPNFDCKVVSTSLKSYAPRIRSFSL